MTKKKRVRGRSHRAEVARAATILGNELAGEFQKFMASIPNGDELSIAVTIGRTEFTLKRKALP